MVSVKEVIPLYYHAPSSSVMGFRSWQKSEIFQGQVIIRSLVSSAQSEIGFWHFEWRFGFERVDDVEILSSPGRGIAEMVVVIPPSDLENAIVHECRG